MEKIVKKIKGCSWKTCAVLGGGILGLSYFVHKAQFFKATNPKVSTFKGGVFICRDVQASYSNMNKEYNQIYKDQVQFGSGEIIGLHFDDPKTLKDQNQCRSTIGFLVDISQQERAEEYVKNNSSYRIEILPEVDVIESVQNFNILMAVFSIKKFYKDMYIFAKKEKIFSEEDEKNVISVESSANFPRLRLMFTFGKNAKSYKDVCKI